MCASDVFFALLVLNKLTAPKFIIYKSTFGTRPSTIASIEVLNEGVRSKFVTRFFLLLDVKVKESRSPGNEVA